MLKKQLLWLLLMPFYLWGVTITEDTTLSEDMTYNEDVIIDGAVLSLNYHTLTVNGDLNITGAYARLQMTKSTDKLIVKGDLTFGGASTYGDLTDGVIELSGNFYQIGNDYDRNHKSTTCCDQRYESDNEYAFYPTDNHKVVLNGNSKQIVDFESPNHSRFNHLEIENSSSEGILFEQLSVVGEWIRNGNSVTITDIRNLTLTENYTIPNDVEVKGGVLNLNGFTLTVNGSLNFSGSYCRLKMQKADDKLIVKGDLTFGGASTYGDLTDGDIELSGNFYQIGNDYDRNHKSTTCCDQRYESDNEYAFYPTDNHKVVLNGNSLQRVSFEAPDYSRFMNLEISNDNIIFDLEAGKKVSVIDGLYLDESLYNSTYKDNEYITFGRYRDIYKTYMTLPSGLNLMALPTKQSISSSQIVSIFSDEAVSHVLKYNSSTNQWQGFGNNETARIKIADNNVTPLSSINPGEGIFVKTTGEVELKFPRADEYGIDNIDIESLSSGWHLIGSNSVAKVDDLLAKNSNIKVIRYAQEGKDYYWTQDEEIQEEYRRRGIREMQENNTTNSGFWVYVE